MASRKVSKAPLRKSTKRSAKKAPGKARGRGRTKGVTLLDVKVSLVERFQDGILEFAIKDKGRTKILEFSVPKEDVVSVCAYLKELGFEHCSLISGVDWKERFDVVYHISSYRYRLLVQMTTSLPHDKPEVETVSHLWGGANWHERETWDLMGITFKGHPKLERLLLPDDFVGHPLRKDYKEVD